MMKNNIVFLYSNNTTLSSQMAWEVCSKMDIDHYIVEDRAAEMLNENGPLKRKIIEEFGEDSYIDGKFNTHIVDGMDFTTSPQLSRLQSLMNDMIVKELESIETKVLVITNQLIEAGLLHLSSNLIVAKFLNGKEYDEYISIESIKEICSHFIEPNEIDVMSLTLKGCLIDCWGY